MKNKHMVDIVIPQYKDVAILYRCLNSLSSIDMPENIKNIWVVENGGHFGANKIIDQFRELLPLKYIYLEEGNLSKARNKAAELSDSEILIFFDNDMKFYSDTLIGYTQAFEKFGEGAFYGGPLEPDYEEIPVQWLNDFLPNSAKGFELGEKLIEYNQPHFLGGNHAIFRKHLNDLGGYDDKCATGDNSGAVGEETRIQEKLLAKGIVGIYVPNAKVKHYVPIENCSPAWILKRAERHGITLANEQKETIKENIIFGVPFFQIKAFIIIAFKFFTSVFVTKGPKDAFRIKYDFFFQWGVIKGFF